LTVFLVTPVTGNGSLQELRLLLEYLRKTAGIAKPKRELF